MGSHALPAGDVHENNRLLDFIAHTQQAGTVDDVWRLACTYAMGLGAANLGLRLGVGSENPTIMWTLPDWATDLYLEKVYPDHDPKLVYCRNNTAPYFHGREFWNERPKLPKVRREYDEIIVDLGNRSLVALPIHSLVSKELGIVTFAFDECRAEFNRLYGLHGAAMHLAALAVHNRVSELARRSGSISVQVTNRERESLLWLGKGLRNDQIAHRMGVSRVTVDFHIANARRKLDAKTREQALVKAIQLNIIQP